MQVYFWFPNSLNPCCSGIWIRRADNAEVRAALKVVLILVVVEYEFVDLKTIFGRQFVQYVLILVVVEYEFVEWHGLTYLTSLKGLNPCCSGIWIRSQYSPCTGNKKVKSLNPCCSGIWIRRKAKAYDEALERAS